MTAQEHPETHIGVFLRHVRTGLGLNLRNCAAVTHTNFTYLGQVERGERNPSAAWLQNYSEALGAYVADKQIGRAA